MSDFKKYIIGVIAFCVFCKCPALFFIGVIVAVIYWLAYNSTMEQEANDKLNGGKK